MKKIFFHMFLAKNDTESYSLGWDASFDTKITKNEGFHAKLMRFLVYALLPLFEKQLTWIRKIFLSIFIDQNLLNKVGEGCERRKRIASAQNAFSSKLLFLGYWNEKFLFNLYSSFWTAVPRLAKLVQKVRQREFFVFCAYNMFLTIFYAKK